jgi:hypothetical protein
MMRRSTYEHSDQRHRRGPGLRLRHDPDRRRAGGYGLDGGRAMTGYPLPSPERRTLVQIISDNARELDAEAAARREGAHELTVRNELMRAAGVLRLVATLIVQGRMSTRQAKFWMVAAAEYLNMVQRTDERGVIR